MGLISKEVEVQACYKTVEHYEKLGYQIPRNKMGGYSKERFVVKVEHLSTNSAVKVDVECDGDCGKILQVKYRDYSNHNHDGKYYCHGCAAKMFTSGENNHNYNPAKTDIERENERNYPEYTEFIRRILARDKYTCQCCGEKHGTLEVHHLDGYNWCKEKRVDETNGITLCESCHSNFHAHYGYGENTKKQFEAWIGRTIELVKSGVGVTPCRQIYCIETDVVYDSAKDACKELGIKAISATAIYNACNKCKNKSVKGYHFLWYDEYVDMTQEDINAYLDYCYKNDGYKKVVCLETEEVFDTCTDAAHKYATSKTSGTSHIARACKKGGMTAYRREDGLALHWMYYDEYLAKTAEEIREIKHTFFEARPIICLSYGIVYRGSIEASKKCGVKISPTSISSACRRDLGQTGKLPNGRKLTWMYYDLFVELPVEKQEQILKAYREDFPPCEAYVLFKKGA